MLQTSKFGSRIQSRNSYPTPCFFEPYRWRPAGWHRDDMYYCLAKGFLRDIVTMLQYMVLPNFRSKCDIGICRVVITGILRIMLPTALPGSISSVPRKVPENLLYACQKKIKNLTFHHVIAHPPSWHGNFVCSKDVSNVSTFLLPSHLLLWVWWAFV